MHREHALDFKLKQYNAAVKSKKNLSTAIDFFGFIANVPVFDFN
jgi:hypothetical protein